MSSMTSYKEYLLFELTLLLMMTIIVNENVKRETKRVGFL